MNRQDFEQYALERFQGGRVAKSWETAFLSVTATKGDFSRLTFLDFGCGDGRYFSYLSQKGFDKNNIYGTEVSSVRIERCQALGFRNAVKIQPNKPLPFADHFFDIVNLVEVIEHIPLEDIDFYFAELKRVLKEEGALILTTPNYPIKRFYDLCSALTKKQWSRFKDDPTHVSFYNWKKMDRLTRRFFPDVTFRPYKEGFLSQYFRSPFFIHKIMAICKKNAGGHDLKSP